METWDQKQHMQGHTRQDKAHVQHDWMSTWQTPGAEFPKSGKMAENSAEGSVYGSMVGHNCPAVTPPLLETLRAT